MRSILSVVNALATTAVVTIILVIGVTALTNGDLLWFLHSFDAQAEMLTIHWEGNVYQLYPGDPGYDEVMQAFATGIEKPSGFEWEVGFSEENIARYREEYKLLEVTFSEPIQVHTKHPFPQAKTYLIPLDKTHAKWRRVFAFPGLLPYTSGPLDMRPENFETLVSAVEKAVVTRQ